MKCPGVHCPGCKESVAIGGPLLLLALAAFLYSQMNTIIRILEITAYVIVSVVAVMILSIVTVIGVKMYRRIRIHSQYGKLTKERRTEIRNAQVRARLIGQGILKPIEQRQCILKPIEQRQPETQLKILKLPSEMVVIRSKKEVEQ